MKKYVSIIVVFVCLGCELIVDIDVPFGGADLVVNSIFNPDSVWTAQITANRHVLDSLPFGRIDNAVVVVYEDGNAIDTLVNTRDGLYRSDNGKPSSGKTYEIKASAKNFHSVSGFSHVPAPVEIIDVTFTSIDFGNETITKFDIKFQDPAKQENYYDIIVLGGTAGEYLYPTEVTSLNESVGIEYYKGDGTPHFLVKDFLFDGQETELSFKSSSLHNQEEVVVVLRSLSEDYYRYLTTLKLQDDTGDDPLAQPVNVYDNIESGFGIFAGYSQSTFAHYNPVPVITGFSPAEGRVGDHVMITGRNLTPMSPDDVQVRFYGSLGSIKAEVVSATDNLIEIIVPPGAKTGYLNVVVNGRYLYFRDFIFEVIP